MKQKAMVALSIIVLIFWSIVLFPLVAVGLMYDRIAGNSTGHSTPGPALILLIGLPIWCFGIVSAWHAFGPFSVMQILAAVGVIAVVSIGIFVKDIL